MVHWCLIKILDAFDKTAIDFDVNLHHNLSTLELLHSPRMLSSVNTRSPGLINHDVNLIKS